MLRWLVARPIRTFLVSLVLIGELLVLGVQGTYASYSSETTNAGSTVSSGTLSLQTTTNSSNCQSWTGASASGNANSNCGTVTIGSGNLFPGQATTQTFTVENTGSLSASKLVLYTSSTGCSPSPGLCDAVEFYLEETTSSGVQCWYPTIAAGACSFDTFSSAGGLGTLTDFTGDYWSSAHVLNLTGGLLAGTAGTRTFTFGFELPSFSSPSAGNIYQAGSGSFPLTWSITQ